VIFDRNLIMCGLSDQFITTKHFVS